MQINNNVIPFHSVGRSKVRHMDSVNELTSLANSCYKTITMNGDHEYDRAFGIDVGDMLFLGPPESAVTGDLVIVEMRDEYHVDTFDSKYDPPPIGVLLGCLKFFERAR